MSQSFRCLPGVCYFNFALL